MAEMLEYVLTQEGAPFIREDLCRRLKAGQVGIVPTETVYGLVCLAGHDDARRRISSMRKRDSLKGVQFLVDSLDHVSWLDVTITPELEKLAQAFWPGPLIAICNTLSGDLVAIKVPENDFICSVIHELGQPLSTASANIPAEDADIKVHKAMSDMNGEPDFVLYDGNNKISQSTVVQVTAKGVVILREGIIPAAEVEKVLGG